VQTLIPASTRRAVLVSWSTLVRASQSEAKSGNIEPSLAIDVADDEISVVDPAFECLDCVGAP
jgi:hypothetical protein